MRNNKRYYSKIVKRKTLKPAVKVIVGLFGILLFSLLTMFFIKKMLIIDNPSTLNYRENGTSDYKVYLKENNYFENKFLGAGQKYIASLIDYIEINYNYNFNASDLFDYEYKYYAIATIKATEKNSVESSKVLYTKDEKILNDVIVPITNSSSYNLNQILKIDYTYFNTLINNFKKDYVLSLDSTVTINFYIELNGLYKNKTAVKSKQVMTIVIPLSEQTIDIQITAKDINNTSYVIEKDPMQHLNLLYVILCSITVVLTLVIAIRLLRFIIKNNAQKTYYVKELNKIMKEYDRAIVKTKNMPLLDNYDIIEIASFQEMLDARESLDKSILYVELIPKHESLFIIISEQLAYIYVLNDEKEIENEK